jgi:hypothetical protein
MTFSDKALRQIGRKLLDRTDSCTLQDDTTDTENPRLRAGDRHLHAGARAGKADVLEFRKHRR